MGNRIAKLCDLTIEIYEWESAEDPDYRFNAAMNFDFPIEGTYGPSDIVVAVGVYAQSAAGAATKLITSPLVQKYIKKKVGRE